mmetsp:Transcript_13335/g.41874  ORF Transcript_13335/g.41874 Transcript_13335/m.41874 type:complete len:250 (+) Transcript_13335:238-987(+)
MCAISKLCSSARFSSTSTFALSFWTALVSLMNCMSSTRPEASSFSRSSSSFTSSARQAAFSMSCWYSSCMCLRSSSLTCALASRLNSWNCFDSSSSTTFACCAFSATYAFISSDCFQRQSLISLTIASSSRTFSLFSSRTMFHRIWASMARISRTSFLVSSNMRWNSWTVCGCAALEPSAAWAGPLTVATAEAGEPRETIAVEFGCPGARPPRLPALLDGAKRLAGEAFAGDCRGLAARRGGLWPGLAA